MLTEQEERDFLSRADKLESLKKYEDLHLGSLRAIKAAQEALRHAVHKSRNQRNQQGATQ